MIGKQGRKKQSTTNPPTFTPEAAPKLTAFRPNSLDHKPRKPSIKEKTQTIQTCTTAMNRSSPFLFFLQLYIIPVFKDLGN